MGAKAKIQQYGRNLGGGLKKDQIIGVLAGGVVSSGLHSLALRLPVIGGLVARADALPLVSDSAFPILAGALISTLGARNRYLKALGEGMVIVGIASAGVKIASKAVGMLPGASAPAAVSGTPGLDFGVGAVVEKGNFGMSGQPGLDFGVGGMGVLVDQQSAAAMGAYVDSANAAY